MKSMRSLNELLTSTLKTFNMYTSFKLKCLLQIEANIELPVNGWFKKNDSSIRLCYHTGQNIKYIYLSTPAEVADLFKKHHLIHSYALVNGAVKMYTISMHTIIGAKGEPIIQERLVPYTWEDIHLSQSIVQTIAAVHEFEVANGVMGTVMHKLLTVTRAFCLAS